MPVGLHAAEHLVLDLDQVEGIEERAVVKERIADILGTGVERSLLPEGPALGIRAFGHANLRGWRNVVLI